MSEGIAVGIIAILVVLLVVNCLIIWFIFLFRELISSQMKHQMEKMESISRSIEVQNSQLSKAIEVQIDQLITTKDKNFNLMKSSQELIKKQSEYKMFFSLIFETLTEDTLFIRSEFFRRFANIPEYQEINSKIIAFENKIEQTRLLLKEQNMLETYNE